MILKCVVGVTGRIQSTLESWCVTAAPRYLNVVRLWNGLLATFYVAILSRLSRDAANWRESPGIPPLSSLWPSRSSGSRASLWRQSSWQFRSEVDFDKSGWLPVRFVTVTSVLLSLGEQVWAQITSTQLSEVTFPRDGRGDKAPFRIQWIITCLFHWHANICESNGKLEKFLACIWPREATSVISVRDSVRPSISVSWSRVSGNWVKCLQLVLTSHITWSFRKILGRLFLASNSPVSVVKRKLQKNILRYPLRICLSPWNNSRTGEWIFIRFGIRVSLKSVENFRFWLKSDENNEHFAWRSACVCMRAMMVT
jgi:hypothetical protein